MREQDKNKSELKAIFSAESAEKSLFSLVKILARHAAKCDYEAYIKANRKPDKEI